MREQSLSLGLRPCQEPGNSISFVSTQHQQCLQQRPIGSCSSSAMGDESGRRNFQGWGHTEPGPRREWSKEALQGWPWSLTHPLASSSCQAKVHVPLPHSLSQTQHSLSDALSLTFHGTHTETHTRSLTNTHLPLNHIFSPLFSHMNTQTRTTCALPHSCI